MAIELVKARALLVLAQALVASVNLITSDNNDGVNCAEVIVEIQQVCPYAPAKYLHLRTPPDA